MIRRIATAVASLALALIPVTAVADDGYGDDHHGHGPVVCGCWWYPGYPWLDYGHDGHDGYGDHEDGYGDHGHGGYGEDR